MKPTDTPSEIIGGFAEAQYCRWDAQDVLEALDDAGYVIVPKEPTVTMIKAGTAPFGSIKQMIRTVIAAHAKETAAKP